MAALYRNRHEEPLFIPSGTRVWGGVTSLTANRVDAPGKKTFQRVSFQVLSEGKWRVVPVARRVAQSSPLSAHTRTLQERPRPAGGGASTVRADARGRCLINRNTTCDRIGNIYFETDSNPRQWWCALCFLSTFAKEWQLCPCPLQDPPWRGLLVQLRWLHLWCSALCKNMHNLATACSIIFHGVSVNIALKGKNL